MSDDLMAFQFKNDPRIESAKKLILEALKDHQSKLEDIRPPKQGKEVSYQNTIAAFTQMRGGNLYFPYLGSGFGNGPLVELLDGSIKYDMISGIGPHYWGHSHPDIIKAAIDAALNDTIMQGHLQQGLEAFHVSKSLLHASQMDHCFLSSSGAMANENALKIAFQKKFPANRILAFEKCFMGRSITLSQVTDKPAYREGIPSTVFVDYIPFYRADEPELSTKLAIETLKKHLKRYPKQHAVMCFEMVQGEAGFYPGSHEFFQALMSIAREHSIAIFADEVQTFGRTSQLFAFQHFELNPWVDIVTTGKLSHICATLFKNEFKPKAGLLSQTFTGSTSSLVVGNFIIQELIAGNYFGNHGKIHAIHHLFVKHFEDLANRYPGCISGPYGIGSMIAFTPFDGDFDRTTRFVHDLFQAGVISFIAGTHPSRVRFLIPIGSITPEDVKNVAEIIEKVIKESL